MGSDREFADGELVPGTRYRVLSQIGAGGMGSVYGVEHVELGKRFVLKALLRELARRKDLVARLRQEWRALARLNHENIINVTDAGTSDTGVPFYVMEFLEGETLAVRLQKRRRLPLAEALAIGAGILDGLAAAHEIGIVHRDVKPPNIFLVGATGVKLLDFGIAKIAHSSAEVITARGVAIGTPRFMSPEQAKGEAVDGRADLYAAGLILYEMVSGLGPFDDAKDANELLLAHIGKEAPRLSWAAPGVPPEVDAVVARLLAKQPSARPASARQVAGELRELVRRAPALAATVEVATKPPVGDATDASLSAVPTNPLPGATNDRTRVPDGEATAVDPISSSTTELATPRIGTPESARAPSPRSVVPLSDRTVPAAGFGDTLKSPLSSPFPVASDFGHTLRLDEYVPPSPEIPTRTAVPVPPGGETPPPVESGDPVPRDPRSTGIPAWIPLALTGVVIATLVAIGTWMLLGSGASPGEPAELAAPPAETTPEPEPTPVRAAEPPPPAVEEPAPPPSASAAPAAPKPEAESQPKAAASEPKPAPARRDDLPKTEPKPAKTPAPKPPAPTSTPKLTLPGSGL